MDNEELSWRLGVGSCESPDVMRRSVSHSPTNSEASTPDVSRRRNVNGKSPASAVTLPHSPRSPRSSGYEFVTLRSPRSPRDFDRSPTATPLPPPHHQRQSSNQKLEEEPLKTNLKRSGTYDLLDQDFDDDTASSPGIKQSNV